MVVLRRTRNAVVEQSARGFKSLRLRHGTATLPFAELTKQVSSFFISVPCLFATKRQYIASAKYRVATCMRRF